MLSIVDDIVINAEVTQCFPRQNAPPHRRRGKPMKRHSPAAAERAAALVSGSTLIVTSERARGRPGSDAFVLDRFTFRGAPVGQIVEFE
ncbi:hypothetical protein [Rhodopseudomonas sp. B29]|uniref:hypothetical protein n=1 Tax=Rhodopseudomonas sp. B29 TaxID=95607 RepID=UPI0011D21A1D|nr:hypothetical protein [Rhodopseudomonas sp. B29]